MDCSPDSSTSRRSLYLNPSAASWTSEPFPTSLHQTILKFHKTLPGYKPTNLVPLEAVAKEIGVKAVYVKDESERCTLPAFKVLGASWAAFQAITEATSMSLDIDLKSLSAAAQAKEISLLAATEGNHGRAIARLAKILSIPSQIIVPDHLDQKTIDKIRSEGAKILIAEGDYDQALLVAQEAAAADPAKLHIQDTAFPGYDERITQWVVDGYSTLLFEIDEQLHDSNNPDLIVAPAGCGSLTSAVVRHSKQSGHNTRVLTVETDGAPCLWKSLQAGELQTTGTNPTIMCGMNCGEVSSIAWPILKGGVDASVTISDMEAHKAVEKLSAMDVKGGPCGGATLAALERLTPSERSQLGLTKDSVVVILCTEGPRDYTLPMDVSSDEPVILTQNLVRIDSSNPDLSRAGGAGEGAIADYIASWLHHRDIETHRLEKTPGRPSIIGIVRGTGGGKSLMINGHVDTVTTAGYNGDPLSGDFHDGRVFGRGSGDMKSGLAAGLIALSRAKKAKLRGDVLVAAVADEENTSIGTEEILAAGWTADGAVISEPTSMIANLAHKGFIWMEVDIIGKAAHGSRFDLGVDAISKAGYFLVELDKYARELLERPPHSVCGNGSVHASLVQGGEEASSYPALCTITIERRTVPGETVPVIEAEFQTILDGLANSIPGFEYKHRVTMMRPPFQVDENDPFIKSALASIESSLGRPLVKQPEKVWTDCALLSEKGIPSFLFGCEGNGIHSAEEWVTTKSIHEVADAVTRIAEDFCR